MNQSRFDASNPLYLMRSSHLNFGLLLFGVAKLEVHKNADKWHQMETKSGSTFAVKKTDHFQKLIWLCRNCFCLLIFPKSLLNKFLSCTDFCLVELTLAQQQNLILNVKSFRNLRIYACVYYCYCRIPKQLVAHIWPSFEMTVTLFFGTKVNKPIACCAPCGCLSVVLKNFVCQPHQLMRGRQNKQKQDH